MKNILILLLITSATLQAQRKDKDKMEQIKAYRTAYFTEQLDLSSQEAEKFWPIFNSFSSEMRSIRKLERKELNSKVDELGAAMTDEEANALIDKKIAFNTQRLELEKKLIKELGAFFPATKILLVFKAEDDFRKTLLERYKKGRK